jgi:probable F420-dependent oxidoreductase
MTKLDLGPTGVALSVTAGDTHLDEARALERLGYRTSWLPGGQIDKLDRIAELVHATTTMQVGSAIISPDVYAADDVARLHAELQSTAPDRFVAGLGASQKPRALAELNRYLDRLDEAGIPVPADRRILAALGPRKLEIARRRCAGAMALLVTPAYTSEARTILGADSTLVIDQFVVLDTDALRARRTARGRLKFLSGVAGYRANFTRMGFSDADIADLSDHLVDELVIWGDADTIVQRIDAQRNAGADHVILAVLNDADQPGALDVAAQLADRLTAETS